MLSAGKKIKGTPLLSKFYTYAVDSVAGAEKGAEGAQNGASERGKSGGTAAGQRRVPLN